MKIPVEYKEITSISDGEARMPVSHTSLMLVGKVGETKTVTDLWYQYEPTAGSYANGTYIQSTNPTGVEITSMRLEPAVM